MTTEDLQVVAFEIIVSSGQARSLIQEALEAFRNSEFELGQQKLDESNEHILAAHKSQTNLLQEYAKGETIVVEIIMVHAQDHLMTTMLLGDIAKEMAELYKRTSH